MKRLVLLLFVMVFVGMAKAEDGHQLWLRYQPLNKAKITGPSCLAAEELKTFSPKDVTLIIDPTMADDAYLIGENSITAKNEMGLLYGAYAMLRGEKGKSEPYFKLRILNHWDLLERV